MSRVLGLVFSGFMVRLYGLGIALWVSIITARYVYAVFTQVADTFDKIPH